MKELDANVVAVGIGSHIYDSLASTASKNLAAQLAKITGQLKSELQDYCTAIIKRSSWVKTIVHPDEAVFIDDLYVPLSYRISSTYVADSSIKSEFMAGAKILVTGTAGGGKSILIKNICSELLRKKADIVPIFYELRYLNGIEDVDLIHQILLSIQTHAPSFSAEMLSASLKGKRFGLVLDGFDEIDHDIRTKIGRTIDRIANQYPHLPIIVTTRPEEDLPGLASFSVYHAEPMSLDQTMALISKIEYEDEIKSSFLRRVESELYDRHYEFLSIPLMASMMLLTYSYYSEIPAKIHIFYRQAFEVLCQRHDRSKGVYTRKSYSGLSIDEFRDVFAYFCAATYMANRYEFSHDELRAYIKESIKYTGAGVAQNSVEADLVESTCLIQRDGINFAFVHRSFQEYFTALFLSKLSEEQTRMMISPLTDRSSSDNVIAMLYEMEPEFLERAWVIPTLDKLIGMATAEDGSIDEYRLVPEVFDKISVGEGGATAGNAAGLEGNEAMTLWATFKIHHRAVALRPPGEALAVMEALESDQKIENEFFDHAIQASLYTNWKSSREIDDGAGQGPSLMVSLAGSSDSLKDALQVRAAIGREVQSWIELRERCRKNSRSKGASLASIIKRAQQASDSDDE